MPRRRETPNQEGRETEDQDSDSEYEPLVPRRLSKRTRLVDHGPASDPRDGGYRAEEAGDEFQERGVAIAVRITTNRALNCSERPPAPRRSTRGTTMLSGPNAYKQRWHPIDEIKSQKTKEEDRRKDEQIMVTDSSASSPLPRRRSLRKTHTADLAMRYDMSYHWSFQKLNQPKAFAERLERKRQSIANESSIGANDDTHDTSPATSTARSTSGSQLDQTASLAMRSERSSNMVPQTSRDNEAITISQTSAFDPEFHQGSNGDGSLTHNTRSQVSSFTEIDQFLATAEPDKEDDSPVHAKGQSHYVEYSDSSPSNDENLGAPLFGYRPNTAQLGSTPAVSTKMNQARSNKDNHAASLAEIEALLDEVRSSQDQRHPNHFTTPLPRLTKSPIKRRKRNKAADYFKIYEDESQNADSNIEPGGRPRVTIPKLDLPVENMSTQELIPGSQESAPLSSRRRHRDRHSQTTAIRYTDSPSESRPTRTVWPSLDEIRSIFGGPFR